MSGPPPLNQVELGILDQALEDIFHRGDDAAHLHAAVQQVVDMRYTEKFRIELETVLGIRMCKIWMGDSCVFDGSEAEH
jgi:hypothetical protein